MKINHGNQHPAKANGFAHVNRNDSKAKESGPGSPTADTSRFKAQERGENNSKIISQLSRQHHSNIKDLDEKKNGMYSPGSKHITRLSPHNNGQIKFRDLGQKDNWQHPHGKRDVLRLSSHGYPNIKLYDGKKLVLNNPIHIRHLNIKHLDPKKNLLHYPIIARIRISVKDFDHAKQHNNHHNLISAHNRLNVKYKIANLPGFKLDSLSRHSGKVSNGNRDYGAVYGLNSKEFASVLRLTELTMRIKAESYGGRIDYDAEYQKALKSWVGHFGGVYIPPEKDSSSHKSAPHDKPAAHNNSQNHVKGQHTKSPHINNAHAKWLN